MCIRDRTTDNAAFSYLLRGVDEANFFDAKTNDDYLEISLEPNVDVNIDNIIYGFFTLATGSVDFNTGNFKVAVEVANNLAFSNPTILILDSQVGNFIAPSGFLQVQNAVNGFTFPANTPIVLRYYLYDEQNTCLLYTSPSPRDATLSRMPSSA